MQAKSWILMRILLNRFHPKAIKEFLNTLPEEEAKQISTQNILATDTDSIFVKPDEFLKNIHYSWVAPYLQKQSLSTQQLIVSVLPNPLASGLKKYLKLKSLSVHMPPSARFFFLRKLYEQIQQPNVLPIDFLPKENLSILLDLSRLELINLIDYLGLYDLAEEIRHIVDKKNLQKVYACLDNKKLQFLRICLHQKSKLITSKLNLYTWDGNANTLLQMLHQRGLYRLGKALGGSHSDFLWHLSRKFDTGRSAILEKYYTKQASPGVTSGLVQQVMNVINFLKQKSEP